MSFNNIRASMPNLLDGSAYSNDTYPLALMVVDHSDSSPGLKQVLEQGGYRVIDTDNGLDAAQQARETQPHLLVVDMDVPLIYELVAARQIIKRAQVGPMPIVIVTHDEIVDPVPMMEMGPSRDEYVTRLADYQELRPLLDYLSPAYRRLQAPAYRHQFPATPRKSLQGRPTVSALTG